MDHGSGHRGDWRSTHFYDGLTRDFASFAAHQFELGIKQKDGATLREHYQAYQQRNGRPHPNLAEAPDLAPELLPLWSSFMELHSEREIGAGGPRSITTRDLHYWQAENGIQLEPWEKRAIRAADRAYFDVRAEHDK